VTGRRLCASQIALQAAGLERLRDLELDDAAYLARSTAWAMEYKRLASGGELAPIGNQILQVRES
jgi:hypothetical protein